MILDHLNFYQEFAHMIPMILLAFGGALFNICVKISKLQNIIDNFSLKIWWNKNSMATLAIIPAIPLTIYGLEQMGVLNWMFALSAGYNVDKAIKENRLFKAFANANKK